MSIRVLAWVLRNSEATLGARLVLIVLAEHAHNDGREAYPSVPTIAEEARLSRRSAQVALRHLEAAGHIERDGVGWAIVMDEKRAESTPKPKPPKKRKASRFLRLLGADPCAYCGAPSEHLDHIEPRAGGDDSWENLTAACARCNVQKSDRPLLAFLLWKLDR